MNNPGTRANPQSSKSWNRDLRIDFFRGLALWMIFTDHIDENPFSHFTYHVLGYSDAKEIFVFLSGISASLCYGRLTRSHGIAWSSFRALFRAAQIYLGYIILCFASFVIVLATAEAAPSAYAIQGDFKLLFTDPARALVAAARFFYTPGYLDILPCYIALVALAPLICEGLRRMPGTVFCGSILLWLAAALFEEVAIPNLIPGGRLGMNPFSWQLLFCIGLWAGLHFHAEGRTLKPQSRIAGACWILVAGNLLAQAAGPVAAIAGPNSIFEAIHETNLVIRLADTENVLRLTHFLAVAYLTAIHLPADSTLLRRKWCRPLLLCGRFSLETFCLGVVLSMAGSLYFAAASPGLAEQFLVNLLGWGLMAGLAASLEAVRDGKAHRLRADWSMEAEGGVPAR